MKSPIPDSRMAGQPGQALTQHDIKNIMKVREDLTNVYYTVWTRAKMGQTFTYTFFLGNFDSKEKAVEAFRTVEPRKGYALRGVICAEHLRDISIARSGTNAEFYISHIASNPKDFAMSPLLFAYFTSKSLKQLLDSETLVTILSLDSISIFEFSHATSRLPS